MLEVKQLSCLRDERVLFSGLSFTVAAGDIVQIEGPNGTGKTSLLRLLAGLSHAESGAVLWRQQAISKQRQQWQAELLYLGHQPGINARLTPLENLAFYHPHCSEAQLFAALEAVALTGYEDLAAAQLSAGQQQRVALARLWLSQATLWILDEPLTALDKSGVDTVMARFVRHAEQGGALIITTHQNLPETHYPLRRIPLCGAEAV